MKKITLLFCCLICFASCFQKIEPASPVYSSTKFHNKRIAVLPFQIHTTIDEIPEGMEMEVINKKEQEKSTMIQLHLYRYMLREYAKSPRKVKLQHFNVTNQILKDKGLDYEALFKLPKNKLARILKVDALVYGNLYQSKKKFQLEGKEDIKNKVDNSVASVIYVYARSKRERILWKDDRSGSGFPSDYASEMTKNLLRKAAKSFPF